MCLLLSRVQPCCGPRLPHPVMRRYAEMDKDIKNSISHRYGRVSLRALCCLGVLKPPPSLHVSFRNVHVRSCVRRFHYPLTPLPVVCALWSLFSGRSLGLLREYMTSHKEEMAKALAGV